MSFESIRSTFEFQGFLAQYSIALPHDFSLNGRNESRILDTEMNSKSVMLTYFDEARSNNGNEFVKVHWFNSRLPDKFFVPSNQKELSESEKKEMKRKQLEREIQNKKDAELKRESAFKFYQECGEPCKYHPYLERKDVHSYYGLKVATQNFSYVEDGITKFRIKKGELIIPVVTLEKVFTSYQRINDQGKKFMGKDTAKSGGIYPIGLWMGNQTKKVILCEGYATGASIFEATGLTVLVCFDIGNIKIVCEALREKYSDVEVTLATDFDLNSKDQAGLIAGLLLAQQFGLKFIFPTQAVSGSDWNDLYHDKGIDEVNLTILTQICVFEDESVDAVIQTYLKYLNDVNSLKI